MSADIPLPEGAKLEGLFNLAANVVQENASAPVDKSEPSQSQRRRPTDSELLELYGLYKVATIGPCNEPQPGIFNPKARTKWAAWKKKSECTPVHAMQEYIREVIRLYNWIPTREQFEALGENQHVKMSNPTGGFAPAVSRPHVPTEVITDQDTPFGFVKDNDTKKLARWLASGSDIDVNVCDEEGLTLLHWAADRGQKEICEILLNAGADPELKDEDELTPLDYALTCEHEDIIKLLKKHCSTLMTPGTEPS